MSAKLRYEITDDTQLATFTCSESDSSNHGPSGTGGDHGGNGNSGGGGTDGDDPGGCGGNSGKLMVVISFESLSPLSQKFFINQLKPLYEEFSKCVEWHFIPCSTSKIVQDVLHCVDGVAECQVDVLHACAAHYYEKDEYKLGKFFICMMTDCNQYVKGEACAKEAGLDWKILNACQPSKDAGKWCDNRYQQLNKLHEPCVPGVIYNWKYDEQADNQSVACLKTGICDQLKKNNMQCAACGNSGGGNSPGGNGPGGNGPGGNGPGGSGPGGSGPGGNGPGGSGPGGSGPGGNGPGSNGPGGSGPGGSGPGGNGPGGSGPGGSGHGGSGPGGSGPGGSGHGGSGPGGSGPGGSGSGGHPPGGGCGCGCGSDCPSNCGCGCGGACGGGSGNNH